MRLEGLIRAVAAAATICCAQGAAAISPRAGGDYGLSAEPKAVQRLSETANRIRMVLSAERAALATLATDRAFALTGGPIEDPLAIPAQRSSIAASAPDLETLKAEDALAAAIARGASDEMIEDLLLGDVAGAVDLANVDRISRVEGDDEWRCLVEAIYFEARGETTAGQVAVAEVVLNRVDDTRYPDTICGVTHQGASKGRGCQFSYECDGKPEDLSNRDAVAKAGKIAHLLLSGRPRMLVGNATHYHADHVKPGWARRLERVTVIGGHIFYRYPTRLTSN